MPSDNGEQERAERDVTLDGNGLSGDGAAPVPDDPQTGRDFDVLLDYLKRSRGFDLSGYKRPSLMRRVLKRVQTVGLTRYGDYQDYLEVHPDEFAQLFNMLLINVTSFFRDPPVWEILTTEVIPRLLAGKTREAPIRVWSAACASGEEAYTLAILLAEAMGLDEFRDRVKIYGTDIDEEALGQARQAVYTAREVANVPEPLRERYFEHGGGRYTFHKDLRRSVIFGRHDLLQDAPISRIDLLACRNSLMYFNTEAQARILAKLHFALNDGGSLVLGKAEMLFSHASLFTPIDLKRRIFSRVPKVGLRDRLLLAAQAGGGAGGQMTNQGRIHEAVFESGPIAQIVIDSGGRMALANERARALFRLDGRDVGRPLQDLEMSYRPVELRSLIEQAQAERRPIYTKDVTWPGSTRDGDCYDVLVTPVQEDSGTLLGAAITFTDVTQHKRLRDELEDTSRELETAYEELQSTNEELETTNEELQSTVEELETTNEELQSTNEELETMNEELQSTNEELQTTNEEARRRDIELNETNAFLSSILGSLRAGVIVLDQNLQVTIWSHQAEDLWGLRGDEVQGRQFLLLDIGLPVDRLREPIRDCLAGGLPSEEILLPARNRRGRDITCVVICTPLRDGSKEPCGVILLMEEQEIQADGAAPMAATEKEQHRAGIEKSPTG